MSKVLQVAVNSQSESFKRINPHLFGGAPAPAVREAEPKERRMRQDHGPKLNKLEAAFKQVLLRELPSGVQLHEQALRFRLGNGVWYKPDFAAQPGGALTCWEVKGPRAFRGGFENLKLAATAYPGVRWVLVWRDPRKGWLKQEVLP